MKTTRLFTLTAAALLSSAIGFAQAGAVDALKKFNNDADGISGNFSQTVHSKKKTQTTYGTFKILRPGLFKWEYTKPYKQTIVGDGKTIWLYDVDLAQVTKSSQDQTIGDSPAAILSNKTALDSSYTLKEDGSANGIDYVLATPKKKQRRLPIHPHRLQRRQPRRHAAERQFRQPNQHQLQRFEHQA